MDIHEYQAKDILGRFGVAIPPGGLAYSPEQAAYRARDIGGSKWIVKAQIHSGGRGKAGGVKLCTSEHQVEEAADHLFGKRLITQQTGPQARRSIASMSKARSPSSARFIWAWCWTGSRSA
jgi:succinyl-CoA synthetase beta subunit